jgi:hypothetical protein
MKWPSFTGADGGLIVAEIIQFPSAFKIEMIGVIEGTRYGLVRAGIPPREIEAILSRLSEAWEAIFAPMDGKDSIDLKALKMAVHAELVSVLIDPFYSQP